MSKPEHIETIIIDDKTVDREWLKFKSVVVPPTAGEGQTQDMKMAFFAGAFVMFKISSSIADSVPDEHIASLALDNVYVELNNFLSTVLERAAKVH